MLFTDFKVPRHPAACHIAACQTLQCVASFPATLSLLYLPDPIFIFHVILNDAPFGN